MSALWPVAALVVLVGAILLASRARVLARLFRWLPMPLWCYVLPMLAVSLGWLPSSAPLYRQLTDACLPPALVLLLLGVDLAAVTRTGPVALRAAVVGAAGIIVGAMLAVALLRPWLPAGAWRGAAALVGTWTGGTMNLLALRALLATPDAMFAPLILVDAFIAYGWMALLVAASARAGAINRWLRAEAPRETAHALDERAGAPRRVTSLAICAVLALLTAWLAARLAIRLPATPFVASASGWRVLLVTTAALVLARLPGVRRHGPHGTVLGSPLLCLVLAATGAQTTLGALWSAPVWLAVGLLIALTHGALLLLVGRAWRIPLGVLATASQANIGGVVSAPLVAAVYAESLVPVGLLLALAGNALGTYVGLVAAAACRVVGGG